jgi:cytochrome c556
MKPIFTTALAALAVVAAVSAPAFANEAAIKARQSLMQIYAFNLGQLGAMAKGEAEYNAEAAKGAADNLVAASSMYQGALWPQGSDNVSMPGKTAALPALWATYPAVIENAKALSAAAAAMAAVAGTDLAGLQGAMGAVGGACSGCHKTLRQAKQ